MGLSAIFDSLPAHATGLVQLGAIKIGGKQEQVRQSANGGAWRAPVKFDHFVITTMNKAANGDFIVDDVLMKQLIAQYGDKDGKLRAIPIRLLSDDIEDVLQSAFVWYQSKVCGARSDGKTVTWYCDPRTGRRNETPVEEDWHVGMLDYQFGGKSMFKTHSIFSCVIASNESRWGGVFKFRTTSIISLRQLYGSLVHLSQLTGGILVGMPLMLRVRPMQVAPDGKATTVHVVHIELLGADMRQIQEQALERSRFRLQFKQEIEKTTAQYRKLLTAPGAESVEEQGDIQEEFVPEYDPNAPVEQQSVDDPLQKKLAADAEKAKARQVASKPVVSQPVSQVISKPEHKQEPAAQTLPTDAAGPAAQEPDVIDVQPEPEAPPAATPEQVMRLGELITEARIQDATIDKWLQAAKVLGIEDMPADAIDKCIAHCERIIAQKQAKGPAPLETHEALFEALNVHAMDAKLPPSFPGPWLAKYVVGKGAKGKESKQTPEWRGECLAAFKAENPIK